MIRSPSLCVKRFSLKKLNRDAAADRTLCRDAYRTARAQNVRPCSFWSLGALLDQWLRPAIFALESKLGTCPAKRCEGDLRLSAEPQNRFLSQKPISRAGRGCCRLT